MTFLSSKWDFSSSPGVEEKYTISMQGGPEGINQRPSFVGVQPFTGFI